MVDKHWTEQEAIAADKEAQRADPAGYEFRTGPLCIWLALRKLDMLQTAHSGGDQFALMSALRTCATHGLPMPEWVASGFIRGFDAIINCRAGSWDEVFGRPYPKGFHLQRARERRQKRFAIHARIRELRGADPSIALDDGLFSQVGKAHGVSKSVCKELYYQAEPPQKWREEIKARQRASGVKRSYRRPG